MMIMNKIKEKAVDNYDKPGVTIAFLVTVLRKDALKFIRPDLIRWKLFLIKTVLII